MKPEWKRVEKWSSRDAERLTLSEVLYIEVYLTAAGNHGVTLNVWGDDVWLGLVPGETREQAKARATRDVQAIARDLAVLVGP